MSLSHFEIEIDKVDGESWAQVISEFNDAVLYQTWSFGTVRASAGNVSHLVLKNEHEILGCCQVNIRRFPWFNVGFADIIWGPLWRRKGKDPDVNVFLRLVQEIKREYGVKRRHLLRIWPAVTGEHKTSVERVLDDEGFKCNLSQKPYRTLRLDLSPPLEELRRNLLQKWRNCLTKAERNGLNIVEGTSDELYSVFLTLAKEMLARKNFNTGMDYQEYRRIQQDLPDSQKMNIVICEAHGKPICVAIYSIMGDTGLYVFGATGQEGLGLNGAYLLQWKILERLKETGVRYYDLGGIDPDNNPGVYHFKLGIGGKSGRDEQFSGEFHGCFGGWAKMAQHILNGSKILRRPTLRRPISRSGQKELERQHESFGQQNQK